MGGFAAHTPSDYQLTVSRSLFGLSAQVMRTASRGRSVTNTFVTTEVSQMFPTVHSVPLFAGRGRARVLETWREAASLVATRWRLFLETGPEGRAWAFASYLAALDAEEAAAAELAALSSNIAA